MRLSAKCQQRGNDGLDEKKKAEGETKKKDEKLSEDEKLMHGPQLVEKAKSQKEIDALLFGDD